MQTLILQLPDDCDATDIAAALVETIAFRLHEAEAEARQAEFYNLGWGVDGSEIEISISSKTSRGILRTNYNSETGYCEHTWSEAHHEAHHEGEDE